MIRIQLPPQEVASLRHAFRTTPDRLLRDRLQVILLAQRGRPHQAIAEDLGIRCDYQNSVRRKRNARSRRICPTRRRSQ